MSAMNQPSTDGAAPQPAGDPYADFRAGVTAALRTWSALRTAVEQEWGGTESAAKAEDLRTNIFTFFDGTSGKAGMTQEDLEDNLFQYMEEEYGIVLEDESERQVADLICRMYETCGAGDVRLVREVVQNAMKGEEAMKQSNVKSVIKSEDDDEMDDISEGEEGDAAMDSTGGQPGADGAMQSPGDAANSTAAAYAAGTLFGAPPKPKKDLPPPRQLGEPEPEKPQPVLDDDGFASVVTKRKGKKR